MSEVQETTANETEPEEVLETPEEVPEEGAEVPETGEEVPEPEVPVEGEEVETPEESEPQDYKEAFKAHPELRKAFFEHNQYKTVFPTVQDAQEGYEKAQTFDDFQTAIQEGDVNPVINAIIDSNPQAFGTFAENFLPNLRRLDPGLYDKAFGPEFSNMLRSAMEAGERFNNKSLYLAAQHISNWAFGKAEPPKLVPTPQQVRQNAETGGRSEDFFRELKDEITVFLNSETVRNLDPNNVLPGPLKKLAATDIIDETARILKNNQQFQRQLQVLRDKAARSGFSYETRKAIRDAYTAMARPVIARLKGPKREEMMKTIGKDSLNNKVEKKTLPSAPGNGRRPAIDPKKIDTSRTSMLDILQGKQPHLKGEK